MANTYMDSQGLYHKYGNTATISNEGGEYKTYGSLREIEVRIDLSTLTTTAPNIVSDVVFFPKNVFIEQVVVDVQTAATSSGSGTIDFGLVQVDRSTEIDFNGFIAAEVKGTYDTAGKKVTYFNGVSKAGALIGTVNATKGYLTANLNTAVYQTGVIYVRIMYRASN